MGLVRDETCGAAIALGELGIGLDAVRSEVDKALNVPNPHPVQMMTLHVQSKKAIDDAYDEARETSLNYIGTEQLLVGILWGTGRAASVLKALGADIRRTREVVRRLPQRASFGEGHPPAEKPSASFGWRQFTSRAREAIFYAQEDAMRAERAEVGTDCLLLGLLRNPACVAARALAKIGIAEAEARESGLNFLGTEHLLLGILRHPVDDGFEILTGLGADIERLRTAVHEIQDSDKGAA